MAKRKNLFTAIGRPPSPKVAPVRTPTGETQGLAPTDNLDMRIPASAYKGGGKVRYHDAEQPKRRK